MTEPRQHLRQQVPARMIGATTIAGNDDDGVGIGRAAPAR
jgi:hypothetical protein